MNKLLIFLLSLCVTSLQGATITNWGAQLPTMVPASGDAILMQKGGVTYYFTPVQLATFISTNLSLGTTNAIPDLNGRGTNATFAATIGVATNLWQLLGTNGLPLVLVTSNQVMIVSNTLVVSARPQSTTTVPLTIAGSQGQDANLFNVKDYLGNVLFAISYDGTFAEPRLASPSISGALWTATDDIGNGAWSTNLTPQNLSVSNVTAARALVINSSKQVTNAATTSAALDNFFAMGITSIVASTGIGIGTNGGALVITNTAAALGSNAVANSYGFGTNTTFYGVLTGATVRATNVYDRSNVKFWGAMGDGVTDDLLAISNAVVANAGGTVVVPQGTYMLSKTIILPHYISIVGEALATFKASSAMTNLFETTLNPSDEAGQFSFQNIRLDGDYKATNGILLYRINVGTASSVDGLRSSFFIGSGVVALDCQGGTFRNIYCRSNFGNGFTLSGCNGSQWDNLTAESNVGSGIYVSNSPAGSGGLTISGILSQGNLQHGICVAGTTSRVNLSGGWVEGNGVDGIKIAASHVSVDNCMVDGAGVTTNFAIHVGTGVAAFSGIIIKDNAVAASSGTAAYAAVQVEALVTNISILNNNYYNGLPCAVVIPATSDPNLVSMVNGYFGVGVRPAAKFHVRGVDGTGIRIETQTDPMLDFYTEGLVSADLRNWRLVPNYNHYGDFSLFVSTTNTTAPSVEMWTVNKDGRFGIGTSLPTNRFDNVGSTSLRSNVFLGAITNVFTFGATNPPPVSAVTPTKWISVRVAGDAGLYRIPLYE